eukprot:g4104.t1
MSSFSSLPSESSSPSTHSSTPGLAVVPFDLARFDEMNEDLSRFQNNEMVKEALAREVDLREYNRSIESELVVLEKSSEADYMEAAPGVVRLWDQISECDSVLKNMESVLNIFNESLSEIGSDLKFLEDNSRAMKISLKNRRGIVRRLNAFLDKASLGESQISLLYEGPVTEKYIFELRQLRRKLRFISSEDEMMTKGQNNESIVIGISPSDTHSAQILKPQFEKLCVRAVSVLRSFLLNQIAQLRQPRTNVHIMQQNLLDRFSLAMLFLSEHAPQVEEEVRIAYIAAMSKTFLSLFRTYHAQLLRLKGKATSNLKKHSTQRQNDEKDTDNFMENAERPVLIGTLSQSNIASTDSLLTFGSRFVEASLANITGQVNNLETSQSVGPRRNKPCYTADAFLLGHRIDILDEFNHPVVTAHVAAAEEARLPYESIFRSVQKHLCDLVKFEFAFIQQVFRRNESETEENTKNEKLQKDVFLSIFKNTLAECFEQLEGVIPELYDPISILIMTILVHLFWSELDRMKIYHLNEYFNKQISLLLHRFQVVIDKNSDSLESVTNGGTGQNDDASGLSSSVMGGLALLTNLNCTDRSAIEQSRLEDEAKENLKTTTIKIKSEMKNGENSGGMMSGFAMLASGLNLNCTDRSAIESAKALEDAKDNLAYEKKSQSEGAIVTTEDGRISDRPPSRTNSQSPAARRKTEQKESLSQDDKNIKYRPLSASKAYAELCCSIIILRERYQAHQFPHHVGKDLNTPLRNATQTLTDAMKNALLRMGNRISSRRMRAVVLINNAAEICTVFEEKGITTQEKEGAAVFEEMLALEISVFVEEELIRYYGSLVDFVKRVDEKEKTQNGGIGGGAIVAAQEIDCTELAQIVQTFAAGWKDGIRGADSDAIKYFSEYGRGQNILRGVLTQLLLYYSRLCEIIKRTYRLGKKPPFHSSMVNMQDLMTEIKRATRSIE